MSVIENDLTELQALEFTNNVRTRMSLPSLMHMPEPIGNVPRMTSAGIAFGDACVVRHAGDGHLYVLIDENKDAQLHAVLVDLGCRQQNRCPKLFNGSTGYLVEVHLPRYLYGYAAPRKVWEMLQ